MEVSQVQGKYEEERDKEDGRHHSSLGSRNLVFPWETSRNRKKFHQNQNIISQTRSSPEGTQWTYWKKGEPCIGETFKSSTDIFLAKGSLLSGYISSNLYSILKLRWTAIEKNTEEKIHLKPLKHKAQNDFKEIQKWGTPLTTDWIPWEFQNLEKKTCLLQICHEQQRPFKMETLSIKWSSCSLNGL